MTRQSSTENTREVVACPAGERSGLDSYFMLKANKRRKTDMLTRQWLHKRKACPPCGHPKRNPRLCIPGMCTSHRANHCSCPSPSAPLGGQNPVNTFDNNWEGVSGLGWRVLQPVEVPSRVWIFFISGLSRFLRIFRRNFADCSGPLDRPRKVNTWSLFGQADGHVGPLSPCCQVAVTLHDEHQRGAPGDHVRQGRG